MGEGTVHEVRPARRSDVARLADLRFKYLAETARLEPRLHMLVEARERVQHSTAAWLSQEERVVLVAEGVTGDGAEPPGVIGFAAGLFSVWPPIWKSQRVGEISECFVLPAARGKGTGRALLAAVEADLVKRGVEVLRAPVPAKNDGSLALFRALGFEALQRVMERPVGKAEGA